jgi:hypothetical protein
LSIKGELSIKDIYRIGELKEITIAVGRRGDTNARGKDESLSILRDRKSEFGS